MTKPHQSALLRGHLVLACLVIFSILMLGCAQRAFAEAPPGEWVEDAAEELVPEYLLVEFARSEQLEHAGNCPLKRREDDDPQPGDFSVLIEGECQGKVGQIVQVTSGRFEISADVVGANMQVVELRYTTASKPKVVILQIAP